MVMVMVMTEQGAPPEPAYLPRHEGQEVTFIIYLVWLHHLLHTNQTTYISYSVP